MNYTVDADGKKHFESWKAPGEPWVRYYGVPCQVDINKKEEYKDYFDPNNELFYLLSKDGAKRPILRLPTGIPKILKVC